MTTTPRPSAEAQRRAEIKRRRETSVFWAAVHLLGSLNVAVILLATIAALIAFATVMESKFDSAVARYYIYDNPLFMLWLLVLVMNLLCAAFTRWPWQRKHIGFVVTHAGIILMLTGAVIGRLVGFEAFVTLDKTKPPENRLITHQDMLTVQAPDGAQWEMPFDTAIRPPTEARPVILPVENTNLKVVIDRATENLVPDDSLAASTDPSAPAGVALRFLNSGMGQNVPALLMLDDLDNTFDFFGMAKVEMVDSLDEAHLIAPVDVPGSAPMSGPPRDETPFHETQMVFANSPDAPVIDTDADLASGYAAKLAALEGKPSEFAVTVQSAGGTGKTWPLRELESRWTSLAGDGDPVQFRVAKYWADFAMKDGVPVSLSEQPHNPAILLQITGPTKLLPPAAAKPAAPAPPMPKGLVMRLALAKEPGRIVYELEREGKIVARAVVAKGETIHLGWSKWEAHVDDVQAHAEMLRDMKELTGDISPMMANSVRPGLRGHLEEPGDKVGPFDWIRDMLRGEHRRIFVGSVGPTVWIPAGASRLLLTGSDLASEGVRVGYGQKVIPLTFSITLENFEVPRDEGTDTPSNYISSLRFDEPSTGRVVHDKAHMNSPAMFPGDFWRSLLGWNYKFSQANWNPENLNETTLQVLYDPGWPFKWIGSLGICCGIALMFYFMPKRSVQERSGRDEPEESK